jgi:glutaminase
MDLPSIAEQAERPHVSTGPLPKAETVQKLVSDAHRPFKSNTDGQNSQVYPALARVPSDLFGVCVVGTSGSVDAAGDTDHEFSIMSVSKPFVFALVCETIGPEEARDKLGANATGLAFNSLAAIEHGGGRTNPMVNAGSDSGRTAPELPSRRYPKRRACGQGAEIDLTGLSQAAGVFRYFGELKKKKT